MSAEGIDETAVTAWLGSNTGALPPLRFEVVAGGRSNLTFLVTDDRGDRLVLRRPPLHSVLESAHDMGREHRIVSALAPTPVPVPATFGYEPDPAVAGAPFYVMDYVEGLVLRDRSAAEAALDAGGRAAAADSMIDVLAALHDVDIDDVGLGDLAKREDYIARQLHRWHGQYEAGSQRDVPLIREVHDRLSSAVPSQAEAAIVHGDYRLDNLIVSAVGEVRAVLDWELCTLGDPLADLGLLMVYWSQPGDDLIPLLDAPTLAEGFPDRQHVADRYQRQTGRDLSELPFYVAFGYWKLAVILEGVYTRFAAGAYAHEDAGVARFGDLVLRLAEHAAEAVREAGR